MQGDLRGTYTGFLPFTGVSALEIFSCFVGSNYVGGRVGKWSVYCQWKKLASDLRVN